MTLTDLATYVGLLLAIAAVLLSPLALGMLLNDVTVCRHEVARDRRISAMLRTILDAFTDDEEANHV